MQQPFNLRIQLSMVIVLCLAWACSGKRASGATDTVLVRTAAQIRAGREVYLDSFSNNGYYWNLKNLHEVDSVLGPPDETGSYIDHRPPYEVRIWYRYHMQADSAGSLQLDFNPDGSMYGYTWLL